MATARKETQYTTVTMDDGRIVDFAGKRRLNKTSKVNPDGSITTQLDFVNGETRLFTMPQSLKDQFAMHGADQKFGDEIAGLEDIDDAILAIDELMDRLNKGDWSIRREANGLAGTSVLARALVEAFGKPASAIKEWLATKSHAEKVALRSNPKVAPIVARLEAEKTKKAPTVDTDALLADLA